MGGKGNECIGHLNSELLHAWPPLPSNYVHEACMKVGWRPFNEHVGMLEGGS